ncbi:MAG: cyclic nucleotide-binding domain-containing protein [Desulfobacteraceae bacterium]|nr:MAG: cyclic nucleotide-binding domain-containing protein [Desulfobacteraceae bacterium]
MENETNILKYLQQIKNIQIFHWLHEDELQKILLIAAIHHYKKGEAIISQGEVGDSLYAVLSGSVDVSVKNAQQEKIAISQIHAGEIFGESAIFLASKRTAGVTCSTDTTVMKINRKDLIFYFKAYPNAGNKVLMLMILNLLNKLRHANEDLVLEKQSDLDFDYVDHLIQDFISQTDLPSD